jgi:dTDP-4-amino-4,6-dideoxygalactose transaminase
MEQMPVPVMKVGVGPGDEVITAPNSFASCSSIIFTGKPASQMCDDMNIDPAKIDAAITPKPKQRLFILQEPADMRH